MISRGGAGFCENDPTLGCGNDAGCSSGPCVQYRKSKVGEELSGIPAGPAGTIDPTFDDDGSVLLGTGRQRDDTLQAVVLQPDGKYVVPDVARLPRSGAERHAHAHAARR